MPDMFRATGGSLQALPRRGGFLALITTAFLYAAPAHAAFFEFAQLDAAIAHFTGLNQHDAAGLALTLGILLSAVVTAVLLVRTRTNMAQS